jgi:hypothetical protein
MLRANSSFPLVGEVARDARLHRVTEGASRQAAGAIAGLRPSKGRVSERRS